MKARLSGRGRRDLFRPRRRHPPADRAAEARRAQGGQLIALLGSSGSGSPPAGRRHSAAETRRPQLDHCDTDAARRVPDRRAGGGAGGGFQAGAGEAQSRSTRRRSRSASPTRTKPGTPPRSSDRGLRGFTLQNRRVALR